MAQDLCKYYKMQKFVSYNSGQTWIPLEEYKKGELYEAHSSDCGSGNFQYRWVLINNSYICDGKDRYTREVYQYSEDGTVWYNVFPTQYRKGTLVERNSPFCDNSGNGQYTSGDTDPSDCPDGYIWNGTECECNGEVIDGICHPCPTNYTYNKTTHECECIGVIDNDGNCKNCPQNSIWNEELQICECKAGYKWSGGICVYVDPLKIVKCENSDGILRQSDVNYYQSMDNWAVLSYTVGDCIYRIDNNAFNGQQIMTSITISDSVHELGSMVFSNCKNIPSISFPSNITSWGNTVFNGCSKLENVIFYGAIPNTIPSFMFNGCISLKTIDWLSLYNITSIGQSAFANCSSLISISLPQALTTIGDTAFLNDYNLLNVTIPSGVTNIGQAAFNGCSGITIATINSNNVSIGNVAFGNCTSLTAVTVESSAVTMGNNVFDGCIKLLKITFTSPTPFAIGEHDFDNTNDSNIFVPCGSLEAYKTAWPQYEDRIRCVDDGYYYRWVNDTADTMCIGTDEYTRKKEQRTTNGVTWVDTGSYKPNELITHYSSKCGYTGEVALTVTNADGYTRYYEPCDDELTNTND